MKIIRKISALAILFLLCFEFFAMPVFAMQMENEDEKRSFKKYFMENIY